MKQPLITIEGKDCSCVAINKVVAGRMKSYCYLCKGKGKSPTKLIFDAKEFIIEEAQMIRYGLRDGFPKVKRYILHKKGDVICGNCCKPLVSDNTNRAFLHRLISDGENCDEKLFRLTSDAVLKSVGELYTLKEYEDLRFEMNFWYKHSLSESSKIVLMEGYYE